MCERIKDEMEKINNAESVFFVFYLVVRVADFKWGTLEVTFMILLWKFCEKQSLSGFSWAFWKVWWGIYEVANGNISETALFRNLILSGVPHNSRFNVQSTSHHLSLSIKPQIDNLIKTNTIANVTFLE